ncbi:MAG: DUF933 domain-containing protein [Candidatus Omnitrophica bacterium]|nr:DUF933 domain-containing protein [Candidatus Omnitrophota bacterium]
MKKLINICYDNFDFITFYTIANDKASSWAIMRGTTAIESAGKIHIGNKDYIVHDADVLYFKFNLNGLSSKQVNRITG